MFKPFERQVINPRERPISLDVNAAATYADAALREFVAALVNRRNSPSASDPHSGGPYTAFIGDSYRVHAKAPAAMMITVNRGLGFYDNAADVASDIGGLNQVDDLRRYHPLMLDTDEDIVVPANGSGNPRWDIVEVKTDRRLQDLAARDVLDIGTGVFAAGMVNKVLSFDHTGRQGTVGPADPSLTGIGYKTGTPAGAPVEPAVTAGYVKIASIYVPNAAPSIADSAIIDYRPLWGLHGELPVNIYAQVTSAAGIPGIATSVSVNAPPGIRVCISNTAPNIYHLYVTLPAVTNVYTFNAFAQGHGAGGGFSLLKLYDKDCRLATAGDIAAIGAGTAIPAGLLVREGQPIFTATICCYEIDAAVACSLGATYSNPWYLSLNLKFFFN